MSGAQAKISQELTINAAGLQVTSGSLYSFLNFGICLKIFIIKKLLKKGWGRRRHNLKTKPRVLHSTVSGHGRIWKVLRSKAQRVHVLPKQRLYLLSTTLRVPNKMTFENFARTFQNYSGRTQLLFFAYQPSASTNYPYSLIPLQGPLLPIPNYCVEQSSY